MQNVFKQMLMIEIGMRGADRVASWLNNVRKELNLTAFGVGVLTKQLYEVGAILGLLAGGTKEAAAFELMEAQLVRFTGSAERAHEQIELIKNEMGKGIFDQQDLFMAVKYLDETNTSLKDNFTLIEKLAARGGTLTDAAQLISQIAGAEGSIPMLVRRLRTFGITPEMLRAQGLNVAGNSIKNPKGEILDALRKIEGKDPTLDNLMKTLTSTFKGLVGEAKNFITMIGTPLLTPLTIAVGLFRDIFKTLRGIDKITNGWAGKFLAGGALIMGIMTTWKILKYILTTERIIAIWAGIRTAIQAGPAFIKGLWQVLKFMFSMRMIEAVLIGLETVRAFLAAAWAAAMGNIPGAIMALALIGAAGYAGYAGYKAASSGGPKLDDEPSSQRPHRRDDVENIYKRMYGDAWTG